MGKSDFLTPKAIANRIKAKGLQKLRWYCQMCQKQCRDENGFKCHCMSESHQRQMEIFGQNPDRIVEGYSEEFEELFMEHMKRSHRFSRIAATVVYNEYINDRHHVHMNSTKWLSLTEFIKYLGKTGKCKVEETAKGWFITYIDRDSETLFKSKMKDKRIRADLVEEEKKEREILKQIERAELGVSAGGGEGQENTEIEEKAEIVGGKVAFALEFDVHSEWVQLASQINFGIQSNVHIGGDYRIGSSDIHLSNVAFATFLNKQLNVTAVDTTSAAVVSASIANGVPHIVFRGTSKRPGTQSDSELSETTGKNVLKAVAAFVGNLSPKTYTNVY